MVSYNNGVKVGKGEVALFVIWYEKIYVLSDKLEYWVSKKEKTNCSKQQIFDSIGCANV